MSNVEASAGGPVDHQGWPKKPPISDRECFYKCLHNCVNLAGLDKKQVERLSLPLMSSVNEARMQTAFTVSIEATNGVTTGISAADRSLTIKTAINPNASENEITTPGHVFPLVARNGGVLERAGHTEASIDISKLSKLNPSSVICEVMNEDGRMARLNDLVKFSKNLL